MAETVTMTRETYVRLRERARVAEALYESEKEHAEATHEWAREAFREQRRLGERITFVYGVAMSMGATHADLKGSD